MSKKAREYASDGISVSYDVRRCIHAAECVHNLPGVFDPDRRPWIDPSRGDPDEIARVVSLCPTGALSFRRLDGGPSEAIPDNNRVQVAADGPLYVRGALELRQAGQDTGRADTRMALCRCGASRNRPFCDDSHVGIGFADPGDVDSERSRVEPQTRAETVCITPLLNGPLQFKGPVELRSADQSGRAHMVSVSLCRCGESSQKPFCDGTHREVGFEAD